MTFNYSKLIGRIAEKGETRESLSAKIGMSSMSLRSKLQGKTTFRQDEIVTIADVLEIEIEEIPAFFFSMS